MHSIDTSKLISAVKCRAALYDKHDSSYYTNPRKQKMDLWKEVCKDVFKDWEEMNALDRLEHFNEVQRRWKNLRNCFTRELGLQRTESLQMETTGEPVKKRKKYEHFDDLLFLIDSVGGKRDEAVAEIEPRRNMSEEDSSDAVEVSFKTEVQLNPDDIEEKANINDGGVINYVKSDLLYNENEMIHNKEFTDRDILYRELVELINTMKNEKHDEDLQFLMSILPAFRKLNDKQRFDARIEILKVLRDITFQQH